MKITYAQLNLKVGDLKNNFKKIEKAYLKALKDNSDIIVYPEIATLGYQPLDLLENKKMVEENIKLIENFAKKTGRTCAVIGYVDLNKSSYGKKLRNACCVCHNGKIIKKIYKRYLPTYDVFDEARYFQPAETADNIITFKNKKILITVCEDIWSHTGLLPDKNLYPEDLISGVKGVDYIINISASPYYYGKIELRKRILSEIAKNKKSKIIYLNLVGANDELIFDGTSLYITEKGKIFSLNSFREEIFTIDTTKEYENNNPETIEHKINAIILGIKDFFKKQNFKKAVLGISGGIDSAVVAWLLAKALGKENVFGLILPSEFTSKNSINDAILLAENLGIKYEIIKIKKMYNMYLKELKFDPNNIDITLQNLQARIRANILMAYSNRYKFLLVTTGNKSEIAVGYSTLYGDSCGAIAPVGDVLKTDIYKIAEFINLEKEIIPHSIITKPPTAELKPNQKDQDDLPPYEILDKIIKLYIEEGIEPNVIYTRHVKDRKLVESVIKRIESNEYKRKQMPPVLKISKKAFGSGRKFPIVKNILL